MGRAGIPSTQRSAVNTRGYRSFCECSLPCWCSPQDKLYQSSISCCDRLSACRESIVGSAHRSPSRGGCNSTTSPIDGSGRTNPSLIRGEGVSIFPAGHMQVPGATTTSSIALDQVGLIERPNQIFNPLALPRLLSLSSMNPLVLLHPEHRVRGPLAQRQRLLMPVVVERGRVPVVLRVGVLAHRHGRNAPTPQSPDACPRGQDPDGSARKAPAAVEGERERGRAGERRTGVLPMLWMIPWMLLHHPPGQHPGHKPGHRLPRGHLRT